ncbi:alpha,alpha-trehalase [Ancylostoma ceylanicum]|uniref:Trehalase n=1 Tax=Ancylostoma ceylanicum TaxID=53326 RepID=A0A0D6LL03_9BILA|nr:alpha,alpha-trehalase [Ancylostoma ceylanicum]
MLYTVLSVLSQIYCDGPILRTVQDSYMFPDSKHFVDMSLKFDPIATLRNFDELGEKANDIAVLREFVNSHFNPPGTELVEWDSFWILKGLIFSEMYETARGIIKNLAYMVDNHGFVPNGGRVYYLTRSQPPLLIPMVYDYFLGTGDLEFVMEVLPTLEKEYLFWINKRSRMFLGEDGKEKFPYYQYRATLHMPRPESYREDYELVHHLKNNGGPSAVNASTLISEMIKNL